MNFNWYEDRLGAFSKSLNMKSIPVTGVHDAVTRTNPIVAKTQTRYNLDEYENLYLSNHFSKLLIIPFSLIP